MPTPRTNSIVKLTEPLTEDALTFDLKTTDRFIFLGVIAQDPTRCVVEGLYCGKRIPYLSPTLFEEVATDDF
jgi:hypothetical protein